MGPEPSRGTGIELLRAVALRAETALRLEADLQTTLLRSIVGATVAIFEAEAASIALYRENTGTLEFVIAAGAQGQGVVGLSIPSDQGIAGYAFTNGEAIAIAEPENDPRFGKDVSAGTGYIPRSILAVPMRGDAARTTGILEVLDKRSGSFTLRDIEIGSVFANQAAVAIQVGARALDVQELLRTMLRGSVAEGDDLGAMISEATRAQAGDDEFWEFVDAVVGLRIMRRDERELTIEILDTIRRHASHTKPSGSSGTLGRFRR